ncbi:unnamed protein product [Pedinophyceae sp. YPF-701]|nr:unnamed protein product [Pedinophyceae sp. YPF-701]
MGGQAEAYECLRCKRSLRARGIHSNNDFRRWAIRNHPDKGGSLQEFQSTSRCVDLVVKQRCQDDPCSALIPEHKGFIETWFAVRSAVGVVASRAQGFAMDVWPLMRLRGEGAGPAQQEDPFKYSDGTQGGTDGPQRPRAGGFGLGLRVRAPEMPLGVGGRFRARPCDEVECVIGSTRAAGDGALHVGSLGALWRLPFVRRDARWTASAFAGVAPEFRLNLPDDRDTKSPRGISGLVRKAVRRHAGGSHEDQTWRIEPTLLLGLRLGLGPLRVGLDVRSPVLHPHGSARRREGWGGLADGVLLGVGYEFASCSGHGSIRLLGQDLDYRGCADRVEEIERPADGGGARQPVWGVRLDRGQAGGRRGAKDMSQEGEFQLVH